MRAARFDRRELAGAVADVGVLVPIATALIVSNGLGATAVLLPAGLLYLLAAAAYGLPVPVQPLKAFGAIAIAKGLGSDAIAAGALLMGVIFLVLGRTGLIDLAARAFPRPLVRGVQLTVGLLFLKIAYELVAEPPQAFRDHAGDPVLLFAAGLAVLALAMAMRSRPIALALVGGGLAIALARAGGDLSLGPSAVELPQLDAATFVTALTVLVIPQLPLTFANSCVATADAARTYFGERAARVRPGRLATTLGLANLLSGSIAGMPVCHGAGGMTAHRSFGARTAGAPLAIGGVLLVLAVGLGAGLAVLLAAFPLPILAGMLAAAGVLHIGLLLDLEGVPSWALALLVGAVGFAFNLAVALALGLVLWWLAAAGLRLRRPAVQPR
ncbi:MAG: putative sulfate/molybdate transporter [Thermoleophilaceae bacterium]